VTASLRVAWCLAIALAAGVRGWNALAGPLLWGYDAGGHLQYVLHLDVYRALPWADQGWSLFHPPLHYGLGWLLAQAGSGGILMRGLSLLGGGLSLATAACAAWWVGRAAPGRAELPLVAFCAVAFLPVQLAVGNMPGNEMTQSLLAVAAFTSFAAGELRGGPAWRRDLRSGLWLGLALLAKHNAVLSLAALSASPLLLSLFEAAPRRALVRGAGRAALIGGVALLLAAPVYLRNVAAFGTPFPAAGDVFPLVSWIESQQPPGERSLGDYLSFPPRLFVEPDPLAPHLLRSVWGSVYLSAWAETHLEPPEATRPRELRVRGVLAALGLLPTLLALAGALLVVRDARRGRLLASAVPLRALGLPLLALTAAGVAGMLVFSWRVPTWAALKASYLLPLSLPFAFFLCRALEALADRARLRSLLLALLSVTALAAAAVSAAGLVLPARPDSISAAAVHYYFGEYERARAVLTRLAGDDPSAPLLDALAAVELADDRAERALELYGQAAAAAGAEDAARQQSAAVARALAGDLGHARAELDALVRRTSAPGALANRGALRAAAGDLAGAERDLAAAVAAEPGLGVAWWSLAEVRERRRGPAAARESWQQAARVACAAPRGPVAGTGVVGFTPGRDLLLLFDASGLRPALPAVHRGACAALSRRAQEPRDG
jgi:tetratricopeptide (TPR) repeat protein